MLFLWLSLFTLDSPTYSLLIFLQLPPPTEWGTEASISHSSKEQDEKTSFKAT